MSKENKRLVGVSLVLASFLLLLCTFVPAAFADSSGLTASPSAAAPNTTISLINQVTVGEATAPGYTDEIVFTVVLTPSGVILGNIVAPISFTSTGSGTYQCSVPFGGAPASLTVSSTGGVTPYGFCTGDDSTFWSGISSSQCPGGTVTAPPPCSGASGLAGLESACTPGTSLGFSPPGISSGDTLQAGNYQVVTCWEFATQSPFASTVFSWSEATTTFQIQPSAGVPQFPFGLVTLSAIAVPVLILAKARSQPFPSEA